MQKIDLVGGYRLIYIREAQQYYFLFVGTLMTAITGSRTTEISPWRYQKHLRQQGPSRRRRRRPLPSTPSRQAIWIMTKLS